MSFERLIPYPQIEGAPQSHQAFSEETLSDIQKHFMRDTALARNFQHVLETLWLNPIKAYMHDLVTFADCIVSKDGQEHSYSGLLSFIEIKKRSIAADYKAFLGTQFETPTANAASNQAQTFMSNGASDVIYSKLTRKIEEDLDKAAQSVIKRDIKIIENALTQMQYLIRVSIQRSEPEFLSKTQEQIKQAQADINKANLNRAYDYCCVLACLGYAVPENILCCFNFVCCDSENEDCCNVKPLINQPGKFSFFAPCISIANFKLDAQKQNEIINAKAPIAQAMI